MNEVQVRLVRASDGYNIPLNNDMESLRWTTLVNGGFGTATFFLPGRPVEVLGNTGLEYLSDIKIFGPGGTVDVLFEGRVEDITQSAEEGHLGVGVSCVGYGILTNEPYRNTPIARDSADRAKQYPVDSEYQRPQFLQLLAGADSSLGVNATRGNEKGFVFRGLASSVGSTLWQNEALEAFPFPVTRLKFDAYSYLNPGGASFRMYAAIFGSYLATTTPLIDSPLTNGGATTFSVGLASGFRNQWKVGVYLNSAGIPATPPWLMIDNIRKFAPRGPSALDDEPVYGHELIQDVIFNSLLTKDYSQVDSDTSYQFSVADFSAPGTTLRNALDYITAFYDRYWAVWENKTIYWKPSTLGTTPDWTLQGISGVEYDLDPTITNAARSVRVAYQDVGGVAREVTYDDPRLDNIFTLAGASKQAQVALPVVANSSAAAQIATTYFPDHSYEVMSGTVTIPLSAFVTTSKQGGGKLPAYKIRAGESLRLTDAALPRDFFSSQYDRKTLLFIRSTDVNWETQTVTLEVDNTRDRLSTLMARISANVNAGNFGGAPAVISSSSSGGLNNSGVS